LIGLIVIVAIFAALASIIAVKTPAWESADEPGHVQNIETLVQGHWYRIDSRCDACAGNEAHQAPLYYLLMAGWQELVRAPVFFPPHNLPVSPAFFFPSAHHGFFLRHPGRATVLWLRFPNIVLSAATVVMTFLAARRLTRDAWIPLVAAALVAFLPRFLFLSAFVTNDNLVNLFGAVLTYCAIRFVQRPVIGWMVATGAMYGLLLTTKLSVIPLGLVVPLLALMVPTWRRRLVFFCAGAVSAVALSGWYLIQNWVRYGDPLARSATSTYLAGIGGLGTLGFRYVVKDPLHDVFVDVPKNVVTYFWYESGWGQFAWPRSVGLALTCVLGLVLVGLFGQGISKRVLLALGSISVLALSCVWFTSFQTATFNARLAFVGLAAMGILVALALQRWPLWVRWILPAVGLVGCVVAVHSDVLDVHWT
jgi:hypothetical protein